MNVKSGKTCAEDAARSKMNRASSLPSSNKNNSQSSLPVAYRNNTPTQAEVVKSRILKSEAEYQVLQDQLKNKDLLEVDVKVEQHGDNPDSPYVDVEALSDGDEKVEECGHGM